MSRNRAAPNLTTVYWLIENPKAGRAEKLTVRIDPRREALPVFSFPEEAEMFLSLWELGYDGWQARESTAGELISVLYGPCASVERVALDPLPEMVGPTLDTTIALVTLSLRGFARRHTARPNEQLARS